MAEIHGQSWRRGVYFPNERSWDLAVPTEAASVSCPPALVAFSPHSRGISNQRTNMNSMLTSETKRDLLSRGFSRRRLGQIAAMLTTGAALPFYNEPALA